MQLFIRFAVLVGLTVALGASPTPPQIHYPKIPPPMVFVSSMLPGIQGFSTPLHSGELGPVAISVTSSASGMAIDHLLDLFVADTHADQIDEFHWTCPVHGSCQWLEIGSAATQKPAEDVAVDGNGNVYASEATNDAIEVFHAPLRAGSVAVATMTFPNTDTPNGITTDAIGNLYVAETERILKFSAPVTSASVPIVLMSNLTGGNNGPYARGFAPSIAVFGDALFIGMNPLPQDHGEIQMLMPPYLHASAHLILPAVGSDVQYLSFDTMGTLYVAAQYGSGTGKGGVYAFHQPFGGILFPFAFVPTDDEGATGVAVLQSIGSAPLTPNLP